MAKILALKSESRGQRMGVNKGFQKVFGNAIGSKATQRKFFKAYKSVANGHAVTKDTARRVFQEAKKQGISERALVEISGKVLKGESASSRLRYLNDIEHASKKSVTIAQQKPKADTNKVIQEIIDKKKPSPSNLKMDVKKNDRHESKVLDFKVSKKNLRNAEHLFVQRNDEHKIQKPATIADYLPHQKGNYSTDEAKTILARIQGNSDEIEKNDTIA